MDSTKKYASIIIVLLIVTVGLLYIDYENGRGSGNSFFSSVLQGVFRPTTLTADVLTKAEIAANAITASSRSDSFFAPYLTLPEGMSANIYHLDNTTIKIYEIQVQNPFKVVEDLTKTQSSQYQFNRINQGTFYLNQIPLEKKTHNYLGIIINNVLYGFEYKPAEHQKVLKIIDALQLTK